MVYYGCPHFIDVPRQVYGYPPAFLDAPVSMCFLSNSDHPRSESNLSIPSKKGDEFWAEHVNCYWIVSLSKLSLAKPTIRWRSQRPAPQRLPSLQLGQRATETSRFVQLRRASSRASSAALPREESCGALGGKVIRSPFIHLWRQRVNWGNFARRVCYDSTMFV